MILTFFIFRDPVRDPIRDPVRDTIRSNPAFVNATNRISAMIQMTEIMEYGKNP